MNKNIIKICPICNNKFLRSQVNIFPNSTCSISCKMQLRHQNAIKNYFTRFWSKVDKSPGLGPNGDCWEWLGRKTRKYGVFQGCRNQKIERTHRVSFIFNYGPILNNLQVLHHCDNPSCVNPNHLFLGTQQDNIQDMINKGRNRGNPRGVSLKLTTDAVQQIQKSCKPNKELSKEYNVHISTIQKIKRKLINKGIDQK